MRIASRCVWTCFIRIEFEFPKFAFNRILIRIRVDRPYG